MTVPPNRVKVQTSSIGTASPISLGNATSGLFVKPVEGGMIDGRTYDYVIEQGTDFEMNSGVYSQSNQTITRGATAILSKILGTVGTALLPLTTGAVVTFPPFASTFDGLYTHGADVAAAATTNLGAANGDFVTITGNSVVVTGVTLGDGRERTARFAGAVTLRPGPTLSLPGGVDIITQPGDFATFRGDTVAGVTRCVAYIKASGRSLVETFNGVLLTLGPAISPATLSGNNDNWAPQDQTTPTSTINNSSVVRMNASGAATVTGIAATPAHQIVFLLNVGTQVITLRQNNSGSFAGNQFLFANDVALGAGQSIMLWKDLASSPAGWRQMAGAGGGGGGGSSALYQAYIYLATGSTATFSGADSNGLNLVYSIGNVSVYQNGRLLVPTTGSTVADYTANNGTSVVLTSPAAAGDVIEIQAFNIVGVVNAVVFDAQQTLSAAQQAQARTNIYAAPFDALAYNGMQVNGSMDVSQELGTTAKTGIAASSPYVLDCWNVAIGGPAVLTAQQVTDAPPGYRNSLKVSVTTADATMTGTSYVNIQQPIEGYRVSRLGFGTSNASPFVIIFWTKIHRAGAYSGSVYNSGGNKSFPFSFTQNAADTWEFKTVSVSVDQAAAFGLDSAKGMTVVFALACGVTYQGTASSWANGVLLGATGTVNGVAATTDVFQITGMAVLPGLDVPSQARAPLIMRPFDQELGLCKRYWQKSYNYSVSVGTNTTAGQLPCRANATSVALLDLHGFFLVHLRAQPTTFTFYSPTGAAGSVRDVSAGSDIGVSSITGTSELVTGYPNLNSTATAGNAYAAHYVADARL